jgi:hypothetical protein
MRNRTKQNEENVAPVDVAPVDVAPVDVAPVDVAPVDVAPVDVEDTGVVEDRLIFNVANECYNGPFIREFKAGQHAWLTQENANYLLETFPSDFIEITEPETEAKIHYIEHGLSHAFTLR